MGGSQHRLGTSTEVKLIVSSVLASIRSISPSLSNVLTSPGTLLHMASNISWPVLVSGLVMILPSLASTFYIFWRPPIPSSPFFSLV